jgi:hypothetical protein
MPVSRRSLPLVSWLKLLSMPCSTTVRLQLAKMAGGPGGAGQATRIPPSIRSFGWGWRVVLALLVAPKCAVHDAAQPVPFCTGLSGWLAHVTSLA